MKYFFLLFLIIAFYSNAIAQNVVADAFKYKVVYKLSYQPDSTDTESRESEDMWLYIGDKVSKFSSRGAALKDSLNNLSKNLAAKVDFQDRIRMTETELDYIIYKGFPEDKISYTLDIVNDQLRYEDDKDLHWEVSSETKNISGYESQKATTKYRGREYIAWFTSDIPISEGPYKFHGLPGLILQIMDSESDYVFELKEFIALDKPIPVKLDRESFILTSKVKLLEIKREFDEDPLSGIQNRNPRVSITVNNKDKRKYLQELKEKLEKKNNPIELE